MLNYANGIFCAYNAKDNTVVIKFIQNEPLVSGAPENTAVQDKSPSEQNTEVGSVVLTEKVARMLSECIGQLLSGEGGSKEL